jgi:hypothetical protein
MKSREGWSHILPLSEAPETEKANQDKGENSFLHNGMQGLDDRPSKIAFSGTACNR